MNDRGERGAVYVPTDRPAKLAPPAAAALLCARARGARRRSPPKKPRFAFIYTLNATTPSVLHDGLAAQKGESSNGRPQGRAWRQQKRERESRCSLSPKSSQQPTERTLPRCACSARASLANKPLSDVCLASSPSLRAAAAGAAVAAPPLTTSFVTLALSPKQAAHCCRCRCCVHASGSAKSVSSATRGCARRSCRPRGGSTRRAPTCRRCSRGRASGRRRSRGARCVVRKEGGRFTVADAQ